ncbi:hypothetical protein MJT46_007627 [Ovis ammon polii x Ovis aries]|nr:hypothetical protein MJT46_007627 [Ovis ammon polii x Ovis aries]
MSLRWNLTPAGELLLVYSFQEPSCLEPVEASPPRVSAEGRPQAFGKPKGTVVSVHIGQVITSIHTTLQNKEHVIEALRRADFRLPGLQKTHIFKKWGFTKFNVDEFENTVAEKQLTQDGCGVTYAPNRGPGQMALHPGEPCPFLTHALQ